MWSFHIKHILVVCIYINVLIYWCTILHFFNCTVRWIESLQWHFISVTSSAALWRYCVSELLVRAELHDKYIQHMREKSQVIVQIHLTPITANQQQVKPNGNTRCACDICSYCYLELRLKVNFFNSFKTVLIINYSDILETNTLNCSQNYV